jgi:hypothetical protein
MHNIDYMNVGQKCQATLEKQSNGGVVFDGWEKGRYDVQTVNFRVSKKDLWIAATNPPNKTLPRPLPLFLAPNL